MDRFELASLVDWAGTLRSRKRLQKVIFLLQQAGCPIEADFILHHFGPYSRDVAETCDDLVASDVLKESGSGSAYSYELTDRGRVLLAQSRTAPDLREKTNALKRFKPLADELIAADLKDLELGSTVAYFYSRNRDWADATQKACAFKKVPTSSHLARRAVTLAQRVVAQPEVGTP